jgi:hypothetical protein
MMVEIVAVGGRSSWWCPKNLWWAVSAVVSLERL